MGDAADDLYDANERAEAAYQRFIDAVRKDCKFSILGRKPCYMIANELSEEELEMQNALKEDGKKLRQLTGEDHGPYFSDLPYRCGHCGKEFDYP